MGDEREPAGTSKAGLPVSERLRQLAGHSVVYGLGGLAAKLVGIFLLPVYTHRVSRADYGEVELVMAVIAALAIALKLGLVNAMFRFSFVDRTQEARAKAMQTSFSGVLVTSTLGLVAGLLLIDPIARVLSVDSTLVIIGVFGLWVTINYDLLTAIYRIEQRPAAFVVFSLTNVAITVGVSLVLVIPLDLGARGIILGNFAGTYVVYVLMLYARRHTVGFKRFDRTMIRRMLVYAMPLVPAGLMLWALNLADRFQIQHLASPEALGSFSAASKIALGIMLLIAAFQTAWAPFAHSILDDGEARNTYRAAFSFWAMVMCWGLVAISAFTPPYVRLAFPRQWWDAENVVPLLIGGSLLYGAYMIVRIGVNRSGRTHLTPAVAAAAMAVNIGLNFVLIPAWGIVGAGVSTIVGYSVLVLLAWLNAQAGFPVSYHWSRVARTVAVACSFVALSVWAIPETGAVGLILRIVLTIAFPLGLVAVGVLTPSDRGHIVALARDMRARRGGRRGAALETTDAPGEIAS
jgi:O-antigen/teichoic acid export membrane protein